MDNPLLAIPVSIEGHRRDLTLVQCLDCEVDCDEVRASTRPCEAHTFVSATRSALITEMPGRGPTGKGWRMRGLVARTSRCRRTGRHDVDDRSERDVAHREEQEAA